MTKLRPDTPLIRETDVFERTDPIVVELYPKYISIRLKGQSEALNVDYGAILGLARQLTHQRGFHRNRA